MTAEREGLADEIARVLGEHAKTERFAESRRAGMVTWGVRCICGQELAWGDGDDHRAHLADLLADLLAARDRRVRGEALREAAEEYGPGQITGFFTSVGGYVRAWLNARADRIEAP